MLQNIRLMAAQTCSRRSFHMSRALCFEKTSSNIASIAKKFSLSPSVLAQAMTHKSFKHGNSPNNERLVLLGRRSLEYMVVDMNKTKNAEELGNAIKKTFDHKNLCRKFDAFGLEEGVQFELDSSKPSMSVKIQAVQALVGAIYHEKGMNAAKEFAKKNFV